LYDQSVGRAGAFLSNNYKQVPSVRSVVVFYWISLCKQKIERTCSSIISLFNVIEIKASPISFSLSFSLYEQQESKVGKKSECNQSTCHYIEALFVCWKSID
jgi:hypothetical protein